jgi:hypothetical protein
VRSAAEEGTDTRASLQYKVGSGKMICALLLAQKLKRECETLVREKALQGDVESAHGKSGTQIWATEGASRVWGPLKVCQAKMMLNALT